jgi:hypothetical protein
MTLESKSDSYLQQTARDNVSSIGNSTASTPGSERSEDDGGLVSSTTVTTELISSKTDEKVEKKSFTLKHTGIRGRSIRWSARKGVLVLNAQ